MEDCVTYSSHESNFLSKYLTHEIKFHVVFCVSNEQRFLKCTFLYTENDKE